jgi:hypothetical protein
MEQDIMIDEKDEKLYSFFLRLSQDYLDSITINSDDTIARYSNNNQFIKNILNEEFQKIKSEGDKIMTNLEISEQIKIFCQERLNQLIETRNIFYNKYFIKNNI